MFLDPEIRDQAYQIFIQEALELLQILEQGLLTLKQDRSVAKIHRLMRAAHSIKGGAASIELNGIKTIAHRLEDVFKALYREEAVIDEEIEEKLLQAYDALRSPILEQIQTGNYNAESAIAKAEEIFAQLEAKLGGINRTPGGDFPSAAELGVDVTYSIFAVDVEQGLQRLEKVLANPAAHQVAGELRAQAEVFAGIGEMFSLTGFVAIAKAMQRAVSVNPQAAYHIGKVALADFRSAQAAVLAGDRKVGGTLSPELANFARMGEQKRLKTGHKVEEPRQNDTSPAPKSPISNEDLASLEDIFGQLLQEDVSTPKTQNVAQTPKEAVATIDKISPKPATDVQLLANHAPLPKKASPAKAKSTPATLAKVGVRVDLKRLERLNNLIGEMVIQENGLLLQNQQLQGILNILLQRFSHFEKLSEELQDWTDHTLAQQAVQAIGQFTSYSTNFDPLEIDSYTDLHSLMQIAVEEIAQIREAIGDVALLSQQSQQGLKKQQQTLKQVRHDLIWSRMLPLENLLQRFPRMVHDLAAKHHKQVRLKLGGMTTLVDKAVLEKLYDPLVHLVHNAFDHGIEPPEVRQSLGKPAEGTIEIRAYHRGNQTYIEVRDDGQGIDLEKIRASVVAKGLLSASEAAKLSPERLCEYLFEPGFSTAKEVSELSGRGMGLETVRQQVQTLKGKVTVVSRPGGGTTFTLVLPLTLTITNLLVFSVNNNLLAIPVDTLAAIATASRSQVQKIRGKLFYRSQEQLIPLYTQSVFNYNYPLQTEFLELPQGLAVTKAGKIPLLLLSQGSQVIALAVEQVLMEQELVIKPFGSAIAPPPYLYGCTILPDGRLVPVIDSRALLELITSKSSTQQSKSKSDKKALPPIPPVPTVMVIDDSLTIQETMFLTLRKAGYRVIKAHDGREALKQLRRYPGIQVVICDIEMPGMNGFEFLSHCRQAFPNRHLPIIILTSRSGEKHRQLAKHLGAFAYLTKPCLKQELLSTLKSCLQQQSSANSPSN